MIFGIVRLHKMEVKAQGLHAAPPVSSGFMVENVVVVRFLPSIHHLAGNRKSRFGNQLRLIGLAGFEPTTSCTPSKRASQAALQPEGFFLRKIPPPVIAARCTKCKPADIGLMGQRPDLVADCV